MTGSVPAPDVFRKLQLKPPARVLLLGAPAGFAGLLGPLPPGIDLVAVADDTVPGAPFDAVLCPVAAAADVAARAVIAVAALRPGGLLWFAYPKKGKGVATGIHRGTGWRPLLALGWGPVRQIALDAVWSAVRFRPDAEVRRKPGSVFAAPDDGDASRSMGWSPPAAPKSRLRSPEALLFSGRSGAGASGKREPVRGIDVSATAITAPPFIKSPVAPFGYGAHDRCGRRWAGGRAGRTGTADPRTATVRPAFAPVAASGRPRQRDRRCCRSPPVASAASVRAVAAASRAAISNRARWSAFAARYAGSAFTNASTSPNASALSAFTGSGSSGSTLPSSAYLRPLRWLA